MSFSTDESKNCLGKRIRREPKYLAVVCSQQELLFRLVDEAHRDKSIMEEKSVDESSQAKCKQKLVYEPWCDNPDSAGQGGVAF